MTPRRSQPWRTFLASSVFAERGHPENDSSICYLVNQHIPIPSHTATRMYGTRGPVWLCPRSGHYTLVIRGTSSQYNSLLVKLIPEGPEAVWGGGQRRHGNNGSGELQGWGGDPTWQLGP